MSRFMHGDSVQVMGGFPDKSIDFILTDPPYLVGFKDRSGRSIANDVNSEWVQPAKPLSDVMSWEYTGNRHHPTEKPVSALRPLIETFTQPGAIVLDPFAGSGSTCVAAQACGRRWIGIELMEQYHAAGLRRLYAHRDARAA